MIVSTANRGDLAALLALEECGFDGAQRWSAASWASELDATGRLVLVSRDASGIDAVACFSVTDETAELLRVIVQPAKRDQGLARRLLGVGKEWAEASGADRMLLEVRQDNDPAVALYSSAGFEPISKRRDYYGPGLDAIIMVSELQHPALAAAGGWLA
ncbi:GNAT family N-acetyltransferase [Propionimicrobium sp. PCR01-08-3]|uniref:GNAT family N-acetyltransferase n=1 Tax=Propionimicrobium sp. PCR01-08-3 TaxID=3052086 RepID=UPI00255CF851|nr:GNAT family N-acetyltransferase [Propionimicrobium sp. PCR01-08-3]WIY83251.1 GNAT family N-acetyltransferase [Propionimicrobium sp. PCR01-08-3]